MMLYCNIATIACCAMCPQAWLGNRAELLGKTP